MGTIENLRKIIQQVLQKYTKIPYSHGEIKVETIFDTENDSYLLLNIGWHGDRRIHGCLAHIDIINDKIWIQRDGTEYGIANELVEAGIPKEQIVLAFHPTEIRRYTEYALS